MPGPQNLLRRELHEGWSVRAVAGDAPAEVAGAVVPATVPGSVFTDLLAAGLIPDPYLDRNEVLLQWVGLTDWRFETSFSWSDQGAERVDLVFDGLDTVAHVELNDQLVADTVNMHRTYRFDVRGLLAEGDNTLAVTFASPVRAADRLQEELGRRPHVNTHPYNAIRKMACAFGWDWGPDLPTSGIWRPVALESWSTARLAAVRPLVTVEEGRGVARVHVDVERAGAGDGDLPVRVRVGDHTVDGVVAAAATATVAEVVVEDPELWWPHSHGGQPLYDVSVELGALDTWTGRVGFRSVELRTEPDDEGTGFVVAVNGEPVFVKGMNWIPDDLFLERVTRERYADRIGQAKAAGVNLLRVWGGGIFESDDFYELCDEQGVLVWQDFLFACATYAEEQPMRGEVLAEARDNITRLVSHPSLALWNGNNENIWGYADWEWEERLDGLSWGAGYYYELLPALVAELDGTRPYSSGSPFSVDPDRHPNDPAHGSMHIWDVWNSLDYTVYRDYAPRFVSEFGWQGPPNWSTLVRAVHDDPLTPESPGVLLHQKAMEGNRKLERGLFPHLPQPRGMEDFHWAMQLNQARAIAFGLEHFRAISPHCMGAVVWQLNDCWPVTSWAAVDGDGKRKPLWYAVRRAFADRLLTVQPADGGLAVVAVNDTSETWEASVAVARRGLDGTVLEEAALALSAGPRQTVRLPVPPEVASSEDPAHELLVAEAEGAARALWHFAEDRDTALTTADLETRVEQVDGGYDVTVHARTFVKDLVLLADKVSPDASVDDMLVTLLPGETTTFHVSSEAQLDADALVAPRVLRSANQLVAG
nr:hypothetical protein [Motilibacter peucedani]